MRDVVRLIQTGKMIKHLYENRCKEISNKYHLTKNEIDILLFLANNQPYDTSRDIVEYRALSKSHVCKSVDSLFSRGYLKGEQDQRDRRLIHLKLQSGPCRPSERLNRCSRTFSTRSIAAFQ